MLDSFDACETERSILLLVVGSQVFHSSWSNQDGRSSLEFFPRSRKHVGSLGWHNFWPTVADFSEAKLCFPGVSADDGGGCFILAESRNKSIFRFWTHFHQLRIFLYDNNSPADTLLYNHQLHKMIKNTNYHLLLFENPILDKN